MLPNLSRLKDVCAGLERLDVTHDLVIEPIGYGSSDDDEQPCVRSKAKMRVVPDCEDTSSDEECTVRCKQGKRAGCVILSDSDSDSDSSHHKPEVVSPIYDLPARSSSPQQERQPVSTWEEARENGIKEFEKWLTSDNHDTTKLREKMRRFNTKSQAAMDSVKDESGVNVREKALSRLLKSNNMVRAADELKPFFSTAEVVVPSLVYIREDVEEANSVPTQDWNKITFVASHMIVPITFQLSCHALVVIKTNDDGNEKLMIVDSNGKDCPHAKRLQNLLSGETKIADTEGVQGGVTQTDMWIGGQFLGHFMGWCSLFALTVCELYCNFGLTYDDICHVLTPSAKEDEYWTITCVLVVVRRAAMMIYGRAMDWYREEARRNPLIVNRIAYTLLRSSSSAQQFSVRMFEREIPVLVEENFVYLGAKSIKRQSLRGEPASVCIKCVIPYEALRVHVNVAIPLTHCLTSTVKKELADGFRQLVLGVSNTALEEAHETLELPDVENWELFEASLFGPSADKEVFEQLQKAVSSAEQILGRRHDQDSSKTNSRVYQVLTADKKLLSKPTFFLTGGFDSSYNRRKSGQKTKVFNSAVRTARDRYNLLFSNLLLHKDLAKYDAEKDVVLTLTCSSEGRPDVSSTFTLKDAVVWDYDTSNTQDRRVDQLHTFLINADVEALRATMPLYKKNADYCTRTLKLSVSVSVVDKTGSTRSHTSTEQNLSPVNERWKQADLRKFSINRRLNLYTLTRDLLTRLVKSGE